MRIFPLLVQRHHFQIGWLSFLAGVFPLLSGREDIRRLPPFLPRDIDLGEHPSPGREHLIR